MTFMIASHAGKKEANLIKVELENAKYELDVAMKENVVLKKRIADLETQKDAVIVKNGKVAERKEVKATNATVENKVVKQVSKSKAKNTSNKNIKINPLDVMYHINFPIMYYKDVEADIINGKLKIPKEKKEEPKRTEVSLSNKYVRYDIIIAKAKSYGRDVSYMTYDFLDDVLKSQENTM